MTKTYEEAMDERLKLALEQANYRTTLLKHQEQLKLKFEQDLKVARNGGSFKVTRELMNFVHLLVESGEDQAVLLDDHEQPVFIDNLGDFRGELIKRYTKASTEFLEKWVELRKARNVGALLK